MERWKDLQLHCCFSKCSCCLLGLLFFFHFFLKRQQQHNEPFWFVCLDKRLHISQVSLVVNCGVPVCLTLITSHKRSKVWLLCQLHLYTVLLHKIHLGVRCCQCINYVILIILCRSCYAATAYLFSVLRVWLNIPPCLLSGIRLPAWWNVIGLGREHTVGWSDDH